MRVWSACVDGEEGAEYALGQLVGPGICAT
jgi:hypothetical protein